MRDEASPQSCRGVRGAAAVDVGEDGLGRAVGELLARLLGENRAQASDVAAAIFTVPEDLRGSNPAAAARTCGFKAVPLLVVREDGGDSRVPRCLRVLLLLNTPLTQAQVHHVYLGAAAELRPDLLAFGEGR